MESIQALAELTSLAMTVPTVLLGVVVVWVWGIPALDAMRARGSLTANDWFIVGVTIGFMGSILDNVYWSIPWTASYLGLPSTDELMAHGVYFNIFFRQAAGIAAAYCHLRAAGLTNAVMARRTNLAFAISNIGAIAVAFLLWFLR